MGRTLADVRALLKYLSKGHCEISTWQHVVDCLEDAAAGGNTIDFAVPLRPVLSMEDIPCEPK
jgi:hypothetical protein